jgi:hypothetical protein
MLKTETPYTYPGARSYCLWRAASARKLWKDEPIYVNVYHRGRHYAYGLPHQEPKRRAGVAYRIKIKLKG